MSRTSLRIAICGLGTATQRAHLPALGRASEAGAVGVVGVTDPAEERRDEVAARCGAVAFEGVRDLLDGCAPDLLVVASPPSSHLAAVAEALERGVDVLCEKPLGVNPGDAAALEELCGRHPEVLLAPVHQYRFAPAWARLAATARSALGAGRPMLLRVCVERPGTDPLSRGGWRAAGLREGGILGDHAVHYMALAWTLDGSVHVEAADLAGEPGKERARVQLRVGEAGRAEIDVSYAGARRTNLVELEVAHQETLRWHDGTLVRRHGGEDTSEVTPALSDRQVVNDLYGCLYEELIELRSDPRWRARRVTESLAVARLLDRALSAVR